MKNKILMTIMLIVIIGLAIYNVYATQPSEVEVVANRIVKNSEKWRELQKYCEQKPSIEKSIQDDRFFLQNLGK